MVVDSIEYELLQWERREVWKCAGRCGSFRHRRYHKELLPAICCERPARLIDSYEQPIRITIEDAIDD